MTELYVLFCEPEGAVHANFCGVYTCARKAAADLARAEETYPQHTYWVEPTKANDCQVGFDPGYDED